MFLTMPDKMNILTLIKGSSLQVFCHALPSSRSHGIYMIQRLEVTRYAYNKRDFYCIFVVQ